MFKAKVAVAEFSKQHQVHVNQTTQWKAQLLDRANEVLAPAAERSEAVCPGIKELPIIAV